MMNLIRVIPVLVWACLASGCGTELASRLAYGAMGGLQQQNCLESPMSRKLDCLQTESYDDYRRKLRETNPAR